MKGAARMTDKQVRFITWLITTATDKCNTIEEVHELNRQIREHSDGLIEKQKPDEEDRERE